MKRHSGKSFFISFIVLIAISSCTSVKAVHDFSSLSSKGLSQFEEIPNSFTKHCLDRCEFESIRTFEIKRALDCDCNVYRKADSVTMLIYHSIRGYFDGLSDLSNKDLAKYTLGVLDTSLITGTFGDIKIDTQQVDAYSAVSNILLNAVAGSYRKKKIKKYVEDANQPIQVLLGKFQFILQKNLEGELDFRKEKLYAFYRELLLNPALNDYQKEKAATDYYQGLSAIKIQQQRIDFFAQSLQSIVEGHQKIYDERNELSAKELRDSLVIYQSALSNSMSQFNKLKN